MPVAANKSQHFVPRCQLRPFTRDGESKSVNLFNLRLAKAIPDAPVKNQCTGDYFYGDDLVLEKRLQNFEGGYGRLLNAILSPGYVLTAEDAEILKAFWLLQHMRTEAAARAQVETWEQIDADSGGFPPEYALTIKDAVQTAMSVFFARPTSISDLSVRLIGKKSGRPFISSDNPAVMTNRWHLTDRRTQLIGPGLESAGMAGFMPLSPEVQCLIYDPDLYAVEHKSGWVQVSDSVDIDACNEQQVLNCQSNLYFRRWEDRGYVEELVNRVAAGRLQKRFEVNYAVFDSEEGGVVTYRGVSAEEARTNQRSMFHTRRLVPTPTRWPSMLRWRAGGVVYDCRSGSSYVRKNTRDPTLTYDKIKIRP
jgi:hypothetical protein